MAKRDVLLWTPILVSPSVWFLSFTANFALAPVVCSPGIELAIYLVSIVSMLVTAASCLLAIWLWRRFQRDEATAHGAPVGRVRSMAIAGIVMSAGFLLVIFAQLLPNFGLVECR